MRESRSVHLSLKLLCIFLTHFHRRVIFPIMTPNYDLCKQANQYQQWLSHLRERESKLSCSQPKAHGVFTTAHVLFQSGCRYAGKTHSRLKILCDSTWLKGIFSSSLTLRWSGQTSMWPSTGFKAGVFAFDNCSSCWSKTYGIKCHENNRKPLMNLIMCS